MYLINDIDQKLVGAFQQYLIKFGMIDFLGSFVSDPDQNSCHNQSGRRFWENLSRLIRVDFLGKNLCRNQSGRRFWEFIFVSDPDQNSSRLII